MNALAAWLAGRRPLRIVLIAALFPLPLVNTLSWALLALSGVLHGPRIAMQDALIALAILLVLIMVSGGAGWQLSALMAMLTWSAMAASGGLTGRFASLTPALQLLVALGVFGLLLASLLIGDQAGFWLPVLQELVEQLGLGGAGLNDEAALAAVAALLTGFVGASLVAVLLAALLLGCWVAAAAGGPAFGPMFRALQLGRVMAIFAILCSLGAVLGSSLAGQWLLLLAVGFVVQGLAVVHWIAAERKWPWPWLLGLYGPLLLIAPLAAAIITVLGSIGYLDNWYPLRRKSGATA